MALLSSKALDIKVSKSDFCFILGYLASPGRIGLIEAQIPEEKTFLFEREFPNAPYFPITQGETTGGNVMKQGCQLRIYFNNFNNCPDVLKPFLGVGNGTYINRINKSKFVEKIVRDYGFSFGEYQDVSAIREAVLRHFPHLINEFEAGYEL